MDYTVMLKPLFESFWYFIPIFIFITVLKTPWFKGVIGEFKVNLLFKLLLPKEKYTLIKNVTLPTEDGTTQVDHILVSKFGVFVIETKNMKGWIFGTEKQSQWTQKIYKHTSKFQNPLRQNYKHTKTIENCLDIDPKFIFSLVIFIGDSTFKTQVPENVTHSGDGIKYIKSKTMEVFSQEQVNQIIEQINSGRLQRGFKTNRAHVAHVKSIVETKESSRTKRIEPTFTELHEAGKEDERKLEPLSNVTICPKCGSNMLLRVSKRGQHIGQKFWGCSSFPKCRTVIKIP
ncbi:NERD domain-containing protein [Reinekea sp.]|jgi:restriction system protein|uniref:NERD domain-containing protein n=1 Tax=Reinekea sp. TaxID=1970455 RepID=UPI00398917F4